MRGLSPLCEEAIYCQRARTAEDQRYEAGEVQEVTFVAWRSKLRAGSSYRDELDRTEPVGQMHGNSSHKQKRGHGQTDQGHESAKKYCQAAEQLSQYGDPRREMWRRH